MKKKFICFAILILTVYILLYPADAVNASRNGLMLWYEKVLPTLLPFAIISNVLIHSGYMDALTKHLTKYFRDEEVSEEVINSFLYDFQHMEESDITEQKIKPAEDADFAKLSEYLAMYFALNNTCSDSDLLEENISFVKEHQPEKFERIQSKIEAMWTDAVLFPVGAIENEPGATVDFANSWRQSRTFGGDRFHEGCDIMASVNQRGIYPIYSVSDGVVENITAFMEPVSSKGSALSP